MKNIRAILLLLGANSVSGVAQGISMIAIPWYFINMSGKGELYGPIYFVVTFFSLFWGPYAGTLVDKYNRKRILLWIEVFGFLIIGSVAFAGWVLGDLPWYLVAAAFACTVFIFNIHYPNLYAFAQEITESRYYGKITSYIEIQGQLTFAMAGAVSAILLAGSEDGNIAFFGFLVPVGFKLEPLKLHWIFMIDACTYLLAFTLIFLIKYESIAQRSYESSGLKDRLKTGIQFLKDNPMVFIFGNASFFVFASILVASFFLMPRYIESHLKMGADVYASTEMFFSLGAMIAGLTINLLFKRSSPVKGIIILTSMAAALYFFFVFNSIVPVFYLAFMLLGLSNAGIRILRMTYLFRTIPNDVIGRTGSIFMMINVVVRLVFILVFSLPFFITDNNVIIALFILGVFNVLGVIVLATFYTRITKVSVPDVSFS